MHALRWLLSQLWPKTFAQQSLEGVRTRTSWHEARIDLLVLRAYKDIFNNCLGMRSLEQDSGKRWKLQMDFIGRVQAYISKTFQRWSQEAKPGSDELTQSDIDCLPSFPEEEEVIQAMRDCLQSHSDVQEFVKSDSDVQVFVWTVMEPLIDSGKLTILRQRYMNY
jgi:hypothetical protein